MKEQENMDNHHMEDNEYRCRYKEMADNPRYLHVYVSVFYAWGLKESKAYHFLYDSRWHSAVCRDAKDGRKVRFPLFRGSISPGKMFRRKPRISWSYCDVTFYFITMKSGSKERELTIPSPDKDLYKPFYWILDTIGKDYGGHPRMDRWFAGFVYFLCRILRPFNIGWVNEIAESARPWRKQNPYDDFYAEHCRFSFQMKEQAPSLRAQLDKFDPAISTGSRPKKPIIPKNQGRRRNNVPRKRPPHR